MANKLTSEGLTVGASTLTNIVKDWGGGSIFVGFDKPGVERFEAIDIDPPVAKYYLPPIGVGEVKLVWVRLPFGASSTTEIYLPSQGRYIGLYPPGYGMPDFILTPSFGFAYYSDPKYVFPKIQSGGGFSVATAANNNSKKSFPAIVYCRIS